MTTHRRKTTKTLVGHVNAELAVVPFDRDPDDLETFMGQEIRVGEESDGSPVTVRFGGHRALDGSSASCVLHVYSGRREVLTLTLEAADRMALELIGQAAMGRQVADPEVVTIALEDCVETQHFDPANPDDASTVMNWPHGRSMRERKVA